MARPKHGKEDQEDFGETKQARRCHGDKKLIDWESKQEWRFLIE